MWRQGFTNKKINSKPNQVVELEYLDKQNLKLHSIEAKFICFFVNIYIYRVLVVRDYLLWSDNHTRFTSISEKQLYDA